MKKKTIDERLKEGVDLPSMDELEDDFAKNLGRGLIFLVVFVVVILVVPR